VRESVREVLTSIDPEGSAFYPCKIFLSESKQELPGRYYHWFIKHWLSPIKQIEHPRSKGITRPFGGRFGDPGVATEYASNSKLLDFAASLPFFTPGFTSSLAMNATTMKTLKEAGFSGLIEREHDDIYTEDIHWNVGHYE